MSVKEIMNNNYYTVSKLFFFFKNTALSSWIERHAISRFNSDMEFSVADFEVDAIADVMVRDWLEPDMVVEVEVMAEVGVEVVEVGGEVVEAEFVVDVGLLVVVVVVVAVVAAAVVVVVVVVVEVVVEEEDDGGVFGCSVESVVVGSLRGGSTPFMEPCSCFFLFSSRFWSHFRTY